MSEYLVELYVSKAPQAGRRRLAAPFDE